ncbi:class I SAM-dependent methyltransferase [Viridibacillus arvi]|uniref:Methyltransferase domain-containing protein n=1 Tax=Viridibacillus arvi TaxID=263475 RepID=A0A0M0LLD2_9BACL|nr:class I SAM-dependent methyltransferase [Viridibacillus arvi]KOO51885.1 hypothetical protein AMD00_05480 [Viridibacillus arvi]
MTIDFHSQDNRSTYAKRQADDTWVNMIQSICEIEGKNVLDIGCGGGIYTKAFAEMGASFVTGLDFSKEILSSAKENCKSYANINFHLGNALNTQLKKEQYDIILERAIIHHINDLESCFKEAFQLLKPGGIFIIQDRTPEDCILEGSPTHIRGYFFSKYPYLVNKETERRHSSEKVIQTLLAEGFKDTQNFSFWETRKTYKALSDLETDLLNRTGRSILYDLSDKQLEELVLYIKEKLALNDNKIIIEKDRWTIWKAIKD